MEFTLSKEERLCKNKEIETLIESGNSSFIFPIKYYWKIVAYQEKPIKTAFSVSKKRFKRANKRNLIKRLLRESYRHQKTVLSSNLLSLNINIQLLIVYISPEIINFTEIDKKIKIMLDTIWKDISKSAR